MKKEDTSFTAPFSLTFTRQDYAHAFVAYFDVAFNDAHKPLGFSTSPQCRSTHWKQTVFYLEDTLTVVPGDVLNGCLKCQPNEKNPRDLDIAIEYSMDGKQGRWENAQEYRMR